MRSARLIDPEGAEIGALGEVVDFTGLRVLEIGCGDGRLTRRYAERASSVLAVDPNEEYVAAARAASTLAHVRYGPAGALDVEVPRSSVDLVFFSWSL